MSMSMSDANTNANVNVRDHDSLARSLIHSHLLTLHHVLHIQRCCRGFRRWEMDSSVLGYLMSSVSIPRLAARLTQMNFVLGEIGHPISHLFSSL